MGRVSNAREQLINAAMQLIWQRSYNAVGVNELCQQAGVKPGSFYYFFPSKRDLILAALEENWTQTRTNVFEPAFAANIDPADRIPTIFQLAHKQQAARQEQAGRVLGCAFGSLGSELGHQDEVVGQKITEIFGRFCSYFERALQETAETNTFPVENIPTRARAILAYLEGILLLARTHNNTELMLQLSPMVNEIAGLKTPTAS